MECFECVDRFCPQGINPLQVNELIAWEYRKRGLDTAPYNDPKSPDAAQRILASAQVCAADYERIFTPTGPRTARYVFFPGCNVYSQPEKLLESLDILELLGEDWAFLPGLDFCCSDVHIYAGEPERADETFRELGGAALGV